MNKEFILCCDLANKGMIWGAGSYMGSGTVSEIFGCVCQTFRKAYYFSDTSEKVVTSFIRVTQESHPIINSFKGRASFNKTQSFPFEVAALLPFRACPY